MSASLLILFHYVKRNKLSMKETNESMNETRLTTVDMSAAHDRLKPIEGGSAAGCGANHDGR